MISGSTVQILTNTGQHIVRDHYKTTVEENMLFVQLLIQHNDVFSMIFYFYVREPLKTQEVGCWLPVNKLS